MRHRPREYNRIFILGVFFGFMMLVIIVRLFFTQIIYYEEYNTMAREQHYGSITIPSRRGDILVKDYYSDDYAKLATNITLDLLYVDPLLVEDQDTLSTTLAEIAYEQMCYGQDWGDCVTKVFKYTKVYDEKTFDLKVAKQQTEKQLKNAIQGYILGRIAKKNLDYSEISQALTPEQAEKIKNLNLVGVSVTDQILSCNPEQIDNAEAEARQIAAVLGTKYETVLAKMTKRYNRYVFIINKIDPLLSQKIKKLKDDEEQKWQKKETNKRVYRAMVLLPEHWRYYPEKELAAQVLGFVDNEGKGRYGIEGYFNDILKGQAGQITSKNDPFGRQITANDSIIKPAEDGSTVVLTIDRVVQAEVEKLLAANVKNMKANSGQVVVMEPYSGKIIAMANYPTFDPNSFGDVYKMKEINYDPGRGINSYVKNEKGEYVIATPKDMADKNIQKYMYVNKLGLNVYMNKIVAELYEPGSVFKSLVMAAGLDAKEVTPQTTYVDKGFIEIDNFKISNASAGCLGTHNMINVINYSCNVGMAFVSKRLGKSLLYDYITNLGFGERTDIELEGEQKGKVDYYKYWSKAQLITTTFGYGITVTPLQMATAYAAIANGGILVRPYIVDEIRNSDGTVTKTEPQYVRRVFDEDTAATITAMLISSTEKGVAKKGGVAGYYVAGKTGTSKIATHGTYETGEGGVIGSFGGFAPANKPRFVILVKTDRPRASGWGETAAGVLFGEVSKFLLEYYNIPPER